MTSRTWPLTHGRCPASPPPCCRYIAIDGNPFYVEGAYAALDAPGEWFHDEAAHRLDLIPNMTIPNTTDTILLDLSIPNLQTLVHIAGSAPDKPASGITLQGITFTHTRRTLLERYLVPSGGDWSVCGIGAVMIRDAADVSIEQCVFNRTGGHAIVLRGGVLRATIRANEMSMLGDSGIVVLGELPGLGNNGSDAVWIAARMPPTYPRDTLITHNHIHGIGIWGKQSAALFHAVACRTTFTHNVAYNGPRAAINVNDGFCGGHRFEGNVLFNCP